MPLNDCHRTGLTAGELLTSGLSRQTLARVTVLGIK
jgi:hypothetical protein